MSLFADAVHNRYISWEDAESAVVRILENKLATIIAAELGVSMIFGHT